MPRQSAFWITLIIAIVAGSILVLEFSNGTFPSFLKSQIGFGEPSSPYPKIVTGRLLFRATPAQAAALHNALQSLTDPTSSFNPNAPETSGTPTPSGTTTRKNQQRITAARNVLPALHNISLSDINPLYPSLASKTKINEPAFRWFSIDLQERPKIIDVNYDNDSPTSFTQRNSRNMAAVERIKQSGQTLLNTGVEFWEPDTVAEFSKMPNDPYYHSSNSWGQGLDDLWWLKQINAEQAWDVTTGSRDVVIAVVDTGIDFSHPDIAGDLNDPSTSNIWQNPGESGRDASGQDKRFNAKDDDLNGFVDDWVGYSFARWPSRNEFPGPNTTDLNGHGTAVSGIVAAIGNNNQHVTGLMWQGRIMPVRMGDHGVGSLAYSGILYATLNGADVINMSWGSLGNGPAFESDRDILRFAANHNVLLVGASGNFGKANREGFGTPANDPHVVAVGASNAEDAKADFSEFSGKIDVVAPGTDLLLLKSQHNLIKSGNEVAERLWQTYGTSGSSPLVAGLAGLVLSVHPGWTAEEVRSTIRATADDVEEPGFDERTGYGRINAGRALSYNQPFPVARITSPEKYNGKGYELINPQLPIPIKGTVHGRTFKRFSLEVGQGRSPTSWTSNGIEHRHSQTLPAKDQILATWDATNLQSGFYSLKLTVDTTFGEIVSDVVQIKLSEKPASINKIESVTNTTSSLEKSK